MLRLVLLVLYLIASSTSPNTKQNQPLGLTTPPPQTDGGGGVDPLGLSTSTPPAQIDGGGGLDPLG